MAGAVQDVAAGTGALATWKHRDLWPPRDIFQGDREGVRAVGIAPSISTESSHISIVLSKSFGRASDDDLDGPGEVPADSDNLDCRGWTTAACWSSHGSSASVVASAGAHLVSWRAVSGDDAAVPPKVRSDGNARGWAMHVAPAPESPPRDVFRAMRVSFLQRTLDRESPWFPRSVHLRRPKLFRFPLSVIRASPSSSQRKRPTIGPCQYDQGGRRGYVKAWRDTRFLARRRLMEVP